MRDYLVVFAAFAVVGAYLFFLLGRWHAHLVKLAEAHDLTRRRTLAARHFPVLLLLLLVPTMSIFLWLVFHVSVLPVPFALAFVAALLPAGIRFARKIPQLKSLGYGRNT